MSGQCTSVFTDSGFDQEVLRSEVPVLVDFWGDGCPPCRQLAPVIDLVACEYAGKMKFGKLDVAANIATTIRYRVRSVPTLILFKGGQVVAERVGAVGKSDLAKMIDPHL
jgi:thioredoxin 1